MEKCNIISGSSVIEVNTVCPGTVERFKKTLTSRSIEGGSPFHTHLYDFQKGEELLCYSSHAWTLLLYKAKCIDRRLSPQSTSNKKSMIAEYLIHFFGWHSKWDEWVTEDRLLKITNINLKYKEQLRIQAEVNEWKTRTRLTEEEKKKREEIMNRTKHKTTQLVSSLWTVRVLIKSKIQEIQTEIDLNSKTFNEFMAFENENCNDFPKVLNLLIDFDKCMVQNNKHVLKKPDVQLNVSSIIRDFIRFQSCIKSGDPGNKIFNFGIKLLNVFNQIMMGEINGDIVYANEKLHNLIKKRIETSQKEIDDFPKYYVYYGNQLPKGSYCPYIFHSIYMLRIVDKLYNELLYRLEEIDPQKGLLLDFIKFIVSRSNEYFTNIQFQYIPLE
ncbi:Chromo/chromo shadow domain,RNA binding activity-knot of a chromodomain,Chromo domain-like [Cinara cedri]|uniref:Chromo/chromo shadow domain,RNA binding activity-knot of a chromodomain,Chromo domain-like n=1 Tax=Cinara cedri TaxID=506608 RepID=A0A5E4N5J1_9HEMI|nr:Chromo/chromo shadow domain,RNA binding activity-knot of a chromodomain,Chromo domain-like [Cinara cedri]